MTVFEVYEKAGVCSLPISPEEAAKRLGIKLVSYRSITEIYDISMRELYLKSRYGFSYSEDGVYIVAVNENSCGERRRRFTIAHEIAHCVLGHISHIDDVAQNERAADRFAADFLAPVGVLRKCGAFDPHEIARLCGISAAAAEICGKRVRSGEKVADEEAINERFQRFIARYRAVYTVY